MAYGMLRALLAGKIAPEGEASAMIRFLAPLFGLVALVGAGLGYAAFQPCSVPTQKARALGLPVGGASCPSVVASASAADAPSPRPRRS